MSKPILCLDFDGVIHSYTSGWKGADVIPDPPVPGADEFLSKAVQYFEVAIFSSRTHQAGGKEAMQKYIRALLGDYYGPNFVTAQSVFESLTFPDVKPPALVTLDDRAIQFEGVFGDPKSLLDFKPWNKKGV